MTAVASSEHTVSILSESPAVAAAPLAALELERMPTQAHFRRDHFPVPELDPTAWRLEVAGAVERPLELSAADLRALPRHELPVVLECAGHRRSELRPEVPGIQWAVGAVSEATWGGTPLAAVLALARPRPEARFVVLHGADHGPFRGAGDHAFARALPLEKALHPDTLLAWEMNGEPLPEGHGRPLRAVVPGWYATDAVKWLVRIEVREEPFDGPFEVVDYRIPTDEEPDGARLTTLAPHALVTSIADGDRVAAGAHVVRGIAWGGDGGIASVEVSVDGGPWAPAELGRPAGPYARVRWQFPWRAEAGPRTLTVRATDGSGAVQPDEPRWNPAGYGNAAMQRVHVLVEG